MLEGRRVNAIRERARRGGSINVTVHALHVARNTVRRYRRVDGLAGVQARPRACRLNGYWREQLRRWIPDRGRWHAQEMRRRLANHGVFVSVRTLRRYVAQLRRERRHTMLQKRLRGERLLEWEAKLPERIARRRNTADHEELTSALMDHMIRLRRKRWKGTNAPIKNWKGYLIKALTNKASDWLKRQATHRQRFSSLETSPEAEEIGSRPWEAVFRIRELSSKDRRTLHRAWCHLRPGDQIILDTLIAENFHLGRTAIRLGLHRNTIGNALRRIQSVFRPLGRIFDE